MASLVSLATFVADVGPLSTDEGKRAESLLADASDLAREIGDPRWTEAASPVSVRLAVKRAARRAFYEDPEGFSSESLGDWSGSKPRTSLDESGVYFTSKEEERIASAAGFRRGVGSLRTPSAYGMGGVPDTLYAPVDGGSDFPLLDGEEVATV